MRVEVRRIRHGFRVTVDGERARTSRRSTCRLIYLTRAVVVKVGSECQNRKEAAALRDAEVQETAAREGVVLPRLLAVSGDHGWIAVERLPLRRPAISPVAREAFYSRVERVMSVAGCADHDPGYWNWAMVGGRPAIYDLGV